MRKQTIGSRTRRRNRSYYDGEGRRVKKISVTEETIFFYDASGQLVAEYSTQISQTPQVSYLTTDHLGSPRVITDQNGAVTNRKDYTAFGEVNYTAQRVKALGYDASAEETRKGYTGYEKDAESGLDFAQARYYNPVHGRFTSVDPLTASASIRNPQTFNRYSYVLNSPYKFTDPLGLIPEEEECRTCNSLSTRSIDEHQAEQERVRKKREADRRRNNAAAKQQKSTKPKPPSGPLVPQKSRIPPSNGVASDEAVDSDLANLFGERSQNPVVTGASQTGRAFVGDHYVLDDGTVYIIHVYGPTGNEDIDIFLPPGFSKPEMELLGSPEANGKYILISTNPDTGAVLTFSHVDSIQSQKDLDTAWGENRTNSAGGRFIGSLMPTATGNAGGKPGNSGGSMGYVHAHITYYVNRASTNYVRTARGKSLNEVRDPQYFRNFRTLVR